MRKRMGQTLLILLILALAAAIPGCSGDSAAPVPTSPLADINSIKTYTQIPGVTDAERSAIEELKSSRKNFTFGSIHSTEAFILGDGRYAGFSTLLCELLSGLFGIPFVQEVHDWENLKNLLENEQIDFIGDLSPTPDRRKIFFMTHPVAERSLGVFTLDNSVKIETESDLNDRRIGFYEDSITAGFIRYIYTNLNFEEFYFRDPLEVVKALEDGVIDAFIFDAVESYSFANYVSIRFKEILPLVYTPVSITAKKSELEPVISVVNKYLEAGGVDRLYELYKRGDAEYAKYAFNGRITAEEREYIRSLTVSGRKIPVALENDNYPISFYNEKESQFQGIAPDYLAEISKLTGIEFEAATNKDTQWTETMEKLSSGEISMVSELVFTEERSGNFLFSEPYSSTRYEQLTKTSYPKLEMFQLVRTKVGAMRGTACEELYNLWFPDYNNLKLYNFQNDVIRALETGEIDLFMASENTLLVLRNYKEKFGFKANIIFDSPV
jgi:ABC-type amino acid transport substrate-binding protein